MGSPQNLQPLLPGLSSQEIRYIMWCGRHHGFILALMSFALLECTGTIYVEKYYGTQCGNTTSSNSSFEITSISIRSFEIPDTGSRASGLPYCTCFSAQSGCASVESGVGDVVYIAVTGSGPYSVALYTHSACTSAYSTTTGLSVGDCFQQAQTTNQYKLTNERPPFSDLINSYMTCDSNACIASGAQSSVVVSVASLGVTMLIAIVLGMQS